MIYLFREGFFHLLFLFYWSLWEPIVFWHFWGLLAGQVQQKPCVLLYWAGRSVTRKVLDFWNRSAGCLVFFHYCLFLLDFFFFFYNSSISISKRALSCSCSLSFYSGFMDAISYLCLLVFPSSAFWLLLFWLDTYLSLILEPLLRYMVPLDGTFILSAIWLEAPCMQRKYILEAKLLAKDMDTCTSLAVTAHGPPGSCRNSDS